MLDSFVCFVCHGHQYSSAPGFGRCWAWARGGGGGRGRGGMVLTAAHRCSDTFAAVQTKTETRPNCAIAANGCGDLPPDSEAALTVIGFNLDGDCIVAKITHEHGFEAKGICPVSFLEPTTRPCLSPSFVHKMGELNLVSRCLALLQLAALPWICCSSTSHTTVGLGLLYWWCDYWAGLFANLFALVYWTEGIDNWWQAQAAGLLCGMLVESAAGDALRKFFVSWFPSGGLGVEDVGWGGQRRAGRSVE